MAHPSATDRDRLATQRRIPVDEYAQKYGFRTSEVVYKIKAGIMDGVQDGGSWYVLRDVEGSRRSTPRDQPLSEDIKDLKSFLRRWVAPRYDELTLLTMSTASIWLVAINGDFRSAVFNTVYGSRDALLILYFAVFLGGMVFSLIHAFTHREKTEGEREGMLFFAITLQGMTAMMSGFYLMFNDAVDSHWIFPTWNLISALLLSYLYRFGIVDHSCILDDDPALWQALAAVGCTFVLTVIGDVMLGYHWTWTLSMTIALASTVSRLLDQAIPMRDPTQVSGSSVAP